MNDRFTKIFSLSLISSILLLNSTNSAVAQTFKQDRENQSNQFLLSEELSDKDTILSNSRGYAISEAGTQSAIAQNSEQQFQNNLTESITEAKVQTITLEEPESIGIGYYQNTEQPTSLTFFEIEF